MKKLAHSVIFIIIFLIINCASKNNTATLSSMIGKNIRGIEIQKWLTEISLTPEIDKFDDCYFYSFKSKGISLRFNSSDILTNLFIYSEGADDFRQYQGHLPFGLSFLLRRQEIEGILGQPDKSGGDGVINYWVEYTSRCITITYNSKQVDNLNAQIYTISINSPQ